MDKKVKVYSTSGCGYCRQAKEFLTERGIEFEIDRCDDRQASAPGDEESQRRGKERSRDPRG